MGGRRMKRSELVALLNALPDVEVYVLDAEFFEYNVVNKVSFIEEKPSRMFGDAKYPLIELS
jgi:hypothetical protein